MCKLIYIVQSERKRKQAIRENNKGEIYIRMDGLRRTPRESSIYSEPEG
jgi:hypothetical protein